MKKNRSNKFTVGLCNTFTGVDPRTLFFEIDDPKDFDIVQQFYQEWALDYITHKTGSGGYHFLSPTMMTIQAWKDKMFELRGINPKCPMTTLRMKPNKYPNEDLLWYNFQQEKFDNEKFNNKDMCQYLNKIFGSNLNGFCTGDLKIVKYPLPVMA